MTKQVILLAGLSNGDEGKGTTTEFLVKEFKAHTVVRYNGGSQAAHHVVTPEGLVHCFAQFGSGTLIPETKTYLSKFMLINPINLHNEEVVLRQKGITDAYDRLLIDEQCLVITPFHQALNKAREIARGNEVHGSCGQGIWETFKYNLNFPDESINAKDLLDEEVFERKFLHQRDRIGNQIQEVLLDAEFGQSDICEILDEINSTEFIDSIVWQFLQDVSYLNIVPQSELKKLLGISGTVVFEGAQGVLLDAYNGFFPYVTGTDITFNNANQLLLEYGYDGEVTRLGIVRAYATRHGAGPFVTEDPALNSYIPDMHNAPDRWQGNFRVGWFDLVATKFAINLIGPLDGLVVTSLDRLEGIKVIKTCSSYNSSLGQINEIKDFRSLNRDEQTEITEVLMKSTPLYTDWLISQGGIEDYVLWLAQELEVPLYVTSSGPTAEDKKIINPAFEEKRDFFLDNYMAF